MDISKSYSRFRILIPAALLLVLSTTAYADVGVPMIFVGLPFVVAALIPVILIESWAFNKATGIGFKRNVKAITLANVFSTFIGYPIVWFIQMALQLGLMFIFAKLNLDYKSPIFHNPLFGVFSMVFASAWLMPIEQSLWWMIPVAGMIGMIPAFFASVYYEHWVAKKVFKNTVPNLKRAIFKSNLASYAFLLMVVLAILIRNFLSLDPVIRPVQVTGAQVGQTDGGYYVSVHPGLNVDRVLDEAIKLPKVISLDLTNCKIHGAPINKIAQLKSLTYLSLFGTDIDDKDLARLAPLINVQKLNLYGTNVDGSGFASFGGWDALTYLDLQGTKVADASLSQFAKFPNLTKLILSYTQVTGSSLGEISGLRKLKTLDLSFTHLTDSGAQNLSKIRYVKELMLYNTNLTDRGLIGVRDLSNLESLQLWNTKINDEGLKNLRNLHHLKNLSINLPAISDSGLVNLEGLQNLEDLDLSGSAVKGEGLIYLVGLKKLKRLWLQKTHVSMDRVWDLQKALPQAKIFVDH